MNLAVTVGALARQLIAKAEDARGQAALAYPKLLESDATDAKSVAELQRVMELLGKTPADLSNDLQAVRDYRRIQELIRDGTGLDAKINAATKAVDEHVEETKRIIAERTQKHRELYSAMSEASQRRMSADRSVNDLMNLRNQRMDLFASEPVVTGADLE